MEMKGYQVLLINEISLVSAEMLIFILSTFSRLHGNAKPFGGICVINFGDLLQLPPIVRQQVFKCMLWRLFFPLFLTQSRCQVGQAEFVDILNEVRVGHVSTKSWQNLMDIYLSYSPRRDLYKSTFIASYRKMAQALNLLVLDSIPSDPKVHYAVDHEGTQVLQLEQSYKTFKSVTNLPEEVDL